MSSISKNYDLNDKQRTTFWKKLFIFLFAIALSATAFQPQINAKDTKITANKILSSGSSGTEFVIAIPSNEVNNYPAVNISIYITSSFNTTVNFKNNMIAGSDTNIIIQAYQITTIERTIADEIANYSEFETPINRTFTLTSSKRFNVYVINRKELTTDGYMAIPTAGWGTRYIHLCNYDNPEYIGSQGYNYGSGFVVLAKSNNTHLKIKVVDQAHKNVSPYYGLGRTIQGHKGGDSISVTLNAGQAYAIQGNGNGTGSGGSIGYLDLSGSEVTSDSLIGLISYHNRTDMPVNANSSRNYLVEMLPPVSLWGKKIVTVEFDRSNKGDLIRAVASEDNTNITVRWYDKKYKTFIARQTKLLNKGDIWDYLNNTPQTGSQVGVRGTSIIEADKPILANQYAYDGSWDNNSFDPFMITLAPVERYTSSAIFQTPSGFSLNYYNFIVKGFQPEDTLDPKFINPVTNLRYTPIEIDSLKLKSIYFSAGNDTLSPIASIKGSRIPTTGRYIALNGDTIGGLYWGSITTTSGICKMQSQGSLTSFGGYIYGFESADGYGWPAAVDYGGYAKDSTTDIEKPRLANKSISDCTLWSYIYTDTISYNINDSVVQVDQGIASISLDTNKNISDNLPWSYNFNIINSKGVIGTSFKENSNRIDSFTLAVINPQFPARALLKVVDNNNNAAIDTVIFTPNLCVPKPKLISPKNKENADTLPKFIWNRNSFATKYRIQISTDSLFATLKTNLTTTDTTYSPSSGLSIKVKYYWRLKTYTASDSSSWSDTWNFKTILGTLENGLIAYYPFTGNANDSSGNGHNGTVNGATLTTDRFGKANSAYSFNGSSNNIELGDFFNYQTFTISLWVQTDPSLDAYDCILDNNYDYYSYKNFMIQHTDTSASGIGYANQISWISSIQGPNSKVYALGTVVPNCWDNIVVLKSNNNFRTYKNGVLLTSDTASDIIYNNNSLLLGAKIGSYSYGTSQFFKGKIDDIRMYDRALTENEIKELCDFGIILNDSSIARKYNVNDTLNVKFSTNHIFKAGNHFTVELSDAQGDFTYPRAIATLASTQGGKISFAIPVNIAPGCAYSLRIVSDSSKEISNVSKSFSINGSDISGDYALRLDGENDYVDFGNWVNNDKFTVSFWMNADSLQKSNASVIGLKNAVLYTINNGVADNYGFGHDFQFNLPHNKWAHITITKDSTKIADSVSFLSIYLYGQLIANKVQIWSDFNASNFTLGRLAEGYNISNWKGYIDELKVWNKVLTADEIKNNVYSKLKGNESNLLGYWNFNEACSDTAKDLTSHAHNGLSINGVSKITSTVPYISQQVTPSKAGNTGAVSISVYDNLFQIGAKMKLTRAGHNDILADTAAVNSDGTLATGSFNLTGADTAVYTVVVTNPDSTVKTYSNSFTIVKGSAPDVWVNIIGPSKVRNGRPFNFLVDYGNNGNIDAQGVVLWVAVPASATLTPNFPILTPDSTFLFSSNLSYYFTDTLNNSVSKIVPLFIPRIAPNTTNSLSFSLDSIPVFAFPINAWTNPPFYNATLKTSTGDCINQAMFLGLGVSPGATCSYNAADTVLKSLIGTSVKAYNPANNSSAFASNTSPFAYTFVSYKMLKDIASNCSPSLNALTGVKKYLDLILPGKLITNCSESFSVNNTIVSSLVTPISSFDPNEKVGPNKYTNVNTPYNYMISFENKRTATTPAQIVSVLDTLDKTKFNLSSFHFSGLGFGDTVIGDFAPSQKNFTKYIDARKKTGVIVKAEGRLDDVSGVVYWKFTSLDTNSLELTNDPTAGFLPPNTTRSIGMGWVSYSVNPYDSLKTGAPLKNKATIVFDYNAPIITNTYENIIDKTAPTSRVQSLDKSQNDSSYTVKWSGTDVGSGIKSYDIYYQIDLSPYILWKQNSSAVSETFIANSNHTYKFYSIATDSAGNIETKTNVPDIVLSNVIPTVTTTKASAIVQNSAISGGTIISNGGASITAKGVVWNISANPTIALSTKTNDGSGSDDYISNIGGLATKTTYYYKAYATNSVGTSYGSELSFTTLATNLALTTATASSITTNSANSGGEITNDGGSSITAKGAVWSTIDNPTVNLTTKTNDGTGNGSFTSSITSLTPNTTYYYKAYAINSLDSAYGNELSFTTLSMLPIVKTTSATLITSTTASSGGEITNSGIESVTARGVVWNDNVNPTTDLATKTNDGIGIGTFTSSITKLTANTTYYCKAYAINSDGTAYGDEVTFTTLATDGVQEKSSSTMTIYPNPTSESATITFTSKSMSHGTLKIMNVIGSLVSVIDLGSLQIGDNTAHISMQGLADGVYTIVINNGNETITGMITLAK